MRTSWITTLAKVAVALTILDIIACQRAGVALPPDIYSGYITKPRMVVVKGRVYYGKTGRDTSLLRDFKAVFSHQLKGGITETITDNTMPRTGRYRIRLRAGYTYEVALMVGDCRVETLEWKASDTLQDSISTQNFYMNYPDSTAYGGCLSGWHPQAVQP